jgi:hypothetical protein
MKKKERKNKVNIANDDRKKKSKKELKKLLSTVKKI